MKTIFKLASLKSAKNILEAGGKAVNLGRLIEKKFPVPAGYVLSADDAIGISASDELNNLFSELNPPFIVRSSATIEDAIATSFAGQFESFYPVNTVQELIDAVRKVRESRKTEKIAKYLSHYNIPENEFKIAAIIQEYKIPIWSGVVFIDQSNGEGSLTIEMSQKAEGIVGGKDIPVRFVVDYSTKQITEKINANDNSKRLANKLIKLSFDIADAFKKPQDIEWVYDGKQVWIVQARPITARNIQSLNIIKEEIARLKNLLGPTPPHLAAHQFAEGLEHATPITVNLFQKFFSANGSLGQVMRSYFIPFKEYKAKRYVIDVLGRLFLNKDYEKEIIFSRIPRKPVQESCSPLAMPLYQARWYYPGFFNFLKMVPGIILLYIGDAKFQISAYRNFKKLRKVIDAERIEKFADLPLTVETARFIVDRLVKHTTPLLFKIALYQQFALSYLEKKIKSRVSDEDWQNLIKTGTIDRLASFVKNESGNNKDILKEVAHRGFQELELSEPRWGEAPDNFFRIINRLRQRGSAEKSAGIISNKNFREKIIEKFPSVWDQQIISTFFTLHDKFSGYREEMHDLWVKEISFLRKILLQLDKEAKLYNTIWYAALDEILSEYPNFDGAKLSEARKKHEIMRKIPLPGDIKITDWDQIAESAKPKQQEKIYNGFSLTSGYAEGMIGTAEMLDKGERVDILLLKTLDPATTIYFENIKGVITEIGGQLAHAAIVAREYGLPVITLENAVRILNAGMKVSMDCSDGKISIIRQDQSW